MHSGVTRRPDATIRDEPAIVDAFVTLQGSAHGRFQRAIARQDLSQAELAAYELDRLSLDDARRRYARRGSTRV